MDFEGPAFCVLAHDQGNGGCLVQDAAAVSSRGGILVYFNVDGRIRDAVAKATASRSIRPLTHKPTRAMPINEAKS